MFFAGKKTIYLSLYSEREKVKSVGFMQITELRDRVKMSMQIKDIAEVPEAEYAVVIVLLEKTIQIGSIYIKNKKGFFEKEFCTSGDALWINGEKVSGEEVTGVSVVLTETEKICGYCTAEMSIDLKATGLSKKKELLENKEPSKEKVLSGNKALSDGERQSEQEVNLKKEFLCMDKWEQILQKYSNIHPFGDERLFVSLQLQDLVILPEKYQKLVHNSFLLHGFYNYRHLILGKDNKLGSYTEKCFYLGVPGAFFEREKQVAVMFGFEGFECAGPVDIGKFGYYVREVAI